MLLCELVLEGLLVLLPICFSVLIIVLLATGEFFKDCLMIFLAMVNYNLLFIAILLRKSIRIGDRRGLIVRMNTILVFIIFNLATIIYVITVNFYAVILLFFGDSFRFDSFCELNCMSD